MTSPTFSNLRINSFPHVHLGQQPLPHLLPNGIQKCSLFSTSSTFPASLVKAADNKIKNAVIIITGANGCIGRYIYHALNRCENYTLVLTDTTIGNDPNNRFGLEFSSIKEIMVPKIPEKEIIKIDLALQKEVFEELINKCQPHLIIHLAGILENQSPRMIEKNLLINRNVLELCDKYNVKTITASSIMVMYGAALNNFKIKRIFEGEEIELIENEKLTVNTPLENNEESIKKFNESNWETNLAYIKTKESLEMLAKNLTDKNKNLTIVCIRFGWTGVKNPYQIEKETSAKLTETMIYLAPQDLQSFIVMLTEAIFSQPIHGFRKYICVSLHPQTWVNLTNDFGWKPKVNVITSYRPSSKL